MPETLETGLEQRLRGLRALVGNTPLLAIDCEHHGRRRTLYAKAEHMNMTGSIKDRMALHVLWQAYRKGELQAGDPIIEATSGNTGIAFAAIGRALGHRVILFMPDWMSSERIDLIRCLGARVELVSREKGGFLGSIERAEAMARSLPRAFLPRQFSNTDNVEAHAHTTGPEIWWQLRFRALVPDAFVAGVGTGGTIMGAGQFLRQQHSTVRVHPVEPANSPTLRAGHRVGKHRIQGISDEFIPPIVDLAALDSLVDVDDGDAIRMAQKLGAELGLGVGISSGANFLAALEVLEARGGEGTVVTVFPDDNKKYLSTDLLRDEPELPGHRTQHVRLLGFRSFKRVCHTCCDPVDCLQGVPLDFIEAESALPPCQRRSSGSA